MSKNKKIFISVLIIVLLIILLVIFSPKLVKRLTGSVAGAQKEVKNEQVNEVCNKDITSDYFITLSGKIIQDFGEEGIATITIKNDNLVFTKEIEVNSNEFNKFNYVLPRGNYDLTVTKDGYKTFESEISDTNDIEIVLNSNSMSEIIASSRTYYNTYYDYYSDGTLHIKAVGDFAGANITNDNFAYSVFYDVTIKYLKKHGINVKTSGNFTPGTSELNSLIISLASAMLADIEQDGVRGRDQYRKAYAKIESGECTASNINDSNCDDVRSLYESFGVDDFENGKKTLGLIINMPVPTNLIIDDNVSYIPNIAGAVGNEININSNVFSIETCALFGTRIGTLTVNSSALMDKNNFASSSKINNLIIGNNLRAIPEFSFSNSQIDNVYLSDSVVNINKSAFENSKINTINLPNNLYSIGSSAFKGTNLKMVVLPKSLTTIGSSAFEDSDLEIITFSNGLTSIEERAFKNTKLKSIVLPDTLTSIGNNAFDSSDLEVISLSKSLTSIGSSAFINNNLSSITIPENVSKIGLSAFSGNPIEQVTILGDSKRFNNLWTSIGFPAYLKPSN